MAASQEESRGAEVRRAWILEGFINMVTRYKFCFKYKRKTMEIFSRKVI